MAGRIASKQEILETIPGRLMRARVHGRLMLKDVKLSWHRAVDSLVDAEYCPPSDASRAHSYAHRAADLLMERNVACPEALQTILNNRGSTEEFAAIVPDTSPETI